ncbi:hypothetical protein ICJ52_30905, partial [Streptomyces sp. KD18]|nr:hypothetical protein [Streptomyces sp. KD18]
MRGWWYGETNPSVRVPRRATLLPGGATLAGRGLSDPVVRPPGRYLYGVDEAVVRAGLVAEVAEDVAEDVGGGLPDASVPAWVTSDEAGGAAGEVASRKARTAPWRRSSTSG